MEKSNQTPAGWELPNSRSITIIGGITYAILLVLALMFYLERTVFLDISFHLFYILKDGTLAIQNYRFGAAITQIFPLAGSWMGLQLDTIMKLYSAGFALVYAGIFFGISLCGQSARYAIIMLLLSTLIVTETFFWIQSELPQGLALMVLFFCLVDKFAPLSGSLRFPLIYGPVLMVLLVTIAFMHPIIFIPFAFVVLFRLLSSGAWMINKMVYITISIIYAGVLLVKMSFFSTEYDSAATERIRNIIYLFPDYIFLPANKVFLSNIFPNYWLLLLGLATVLAFYGYRRMWLKLMLVLFFFAGHLFLINVSYFYTTFGFYLENLLLPLSLFVAFPLAFDLAPSVQRKHVVSSVLAVVMVFSIMRIVYTSGFYTERLEYLTQWTDRARDADITKLMIHTSKVPMDTLLMNWATPYEFWLLSTIRHGETLSVFFTETPEELAGPFGRSDVFVTQWGHLPYIDLPDTYFRFNDTTSEYVVLDEPL